MQSLVRKFLLPMVAVLAVAGCGGGSSNKNTVAVVNLNPASISIVAGQVTQLSVSAVNSAGNAVTSTFTFNSSNPNLVTVSPAGLVCGGVWDSTFVTCNGNDLQGNPLTGSATITATAAGITSGPVSVSVHPSVTSIQITNLVAAGTCLSQAQTHQFNAKALHNTTDITSQIGQFSWSSTDGTVVSVDANGLATANSPGAAQIVASVGTVTSQGVSFTSCMPQQLLLHIAGDPAGQPTEAVDINPADTRTVQVDMIDTNGVVTSPAPVNIFSNNPAVATVSGTAVTAVSPGGAGLTAVCAPPRCGNGIGRLVYSNLFSVVVNGSSPATTVYVGTTTIPAPGTSPAIVPIDTSKSPPAAGTPIALPGAPTSIAFSRDGLKGWVDTSSGLLSLDPLANTVTLVDADPVGVILAVSPDGTKVIISNVKFQTDVPSQRLFIFDSGNHTLTTFIKPGAIAAAFTSDGSKAYIATNNGNVYVFSTTATLRTLTLAGSFNSAATIAAGPFAYLASGTAVNTLNVCNDAQNSDLPTSSAPQFVGAALVSNTVLVANQSGVDVQRATFNDQTIGSCPSPVSYADETQNFGVGTFKANKLIVPSTAVRVPVLPSGINKVLVAVPNGSPTSFTLASGGTEPVSGDITLDGATLWVGVAGSHTVDRIDLTGGGDNLQLQLNLNGTNAVPDILAVRPK
jgi:trimeric autotransporter adhesin